MPQIYINKSFEGYYPVGTAAVIIADSAKDAVIMLNEQLTDASLPASARLEDMIEVPFIEGTVAILNDGNY